MSYSDEFVAREFPTSSKELQQEIKKKLEGLEESYNRGIKFHSPVDNSEVPISDFIQYIKNFIAKYPIEFADPTGKTDKSKLKPGQEAIILRHNAIDLSRDKVPTKEEDYMNTIYNKWIYQFRSI